jgi:hypothetical protein
MKPLLSESSKLGQIFKLLPLILCLMSSLSIRTSWGQQSSSGSLSSLGGQVGGGGERGLMSAATTSIYEAVGDYESVDIDDDNSLNADKEDSAMQKPRGKTLTFLKELRNITKNAGESLKLRCEVTGTAPASEFLW